MKVLLCSENEIWTAEIRRDLQRFGHTIVLAHSEAEALRCVRTEWLECVVIDRDEMGLAPLHALRSRPWSENVPAIVLQDRADQPLFETYAAGADMVLEKPFDPSELHAFFNRR